MSGRFPTLDPLSLDLFGDVISSPAPGSGRSPAALLAGQLSASCGPAHVPVSRFRSLDSGKAMSTDVTSGPLFTASSPSAALQRLLESRLRARMDGSGSPECGLTWRALDMPAGPPICQLAVSARRRSATGSGGSQWRSPNHREKGGGDYSDSAKAAARIESGHQVNLQDQMLAAQWPTPMAGTPTQNGYNAAGNNDSSRKMEVILGLRETVNGRKAQWPTPTGQADAGSRNGPNSKAHPGLSLSDAMLTGNSVGRSGPTPSGSTAQTAKRGAPNPVFACWLMGWPDDLISGALQAIQSFRSLRRKCSAR